MNQSQTHTVEHVSDVIKVLNSGIDFYEKAQDEINDPRVKTVFSKMIDARHRAVTRLQPYAIAEQSEKESGSDFSVQARKVYTQVLASIKSDERATYVTQLEEVEDKTLEELEAALDKDQPSLCRSALTETYAQMKNCHDQMLALQKATEH